MTPSSDDRLAATYDRIAPARGESGAAPAPLAPTTASQPATTDPLAAAIDGARTAIVASLGAVERAARDTTIAVRALKATGGVAG